jgi:hypothetical protein
MLIIPRKGIKVTASSDYLTLNTARQKDLNPQPAHSLGQAFARKPADSEARWKAHVNVC